MSSQFRRLIPSLAGILQQCYLPKTEIANKKEAYYWKNCIPIRKWAPSVNKDIDWNITYQIVVPFSYRNQIQSLTHDNALSGHLGICKTHYRILMNFFRPGLKSDVSNYCHSCHVCQLAGKTNQGTPQAPLYPICVIGEPSLTLSVRCPSKNLVTNIS